MKYKYFRWDGGLRGAAEREDDRAGAVVPRRRAEPAEGGAAAPHRGDQEEAPKRESTNKQSIGLLSSEVLSDHSLSLNQIGYRSTMRGSQSISDLSMTPDPSMQNNLRGSGVSGKGKERIHR